MDWINIASTKYHCKIIKASSSQDEMRNPPQSILMDDRSNVWVSGEGLPQQLIISLQAVQLNYLYITGIGFNCQHAYETNPKTIQVWTAKNEESAQNGEYVYWERVQLKKKRGRQMFSIQQIPESERIIKISITQTFGEFQTYLNQIMLLAEPDQHTSQSIINQEQVIKSKQILKMKKSGKIDKQYQNDFKSFSNKNSRYKSLTPFELLKQNQSNQSESIKQQKRLQIQDMIDPIDPSFEMNAAMLAISKNMIVMEDNVEQLSRKVQILEKKISYTYQNLEENIMKKVQEMIDRKIQKQLSQKDLKVGLINQKSHKDLGTSRTTNKLGSYEKYKQSKLKNLVQDLNDKLRERAKLTKKLQNRLKIKDQVKYE